MIAKYLLDDFVIDWLGLPLFNTVIVYSAINQHKVFSEDRVVDEVLDIQLAIADIFS